MSALAGKVAIVTGAGAGIGRASAVLFAREGAKVVVADMDAAGGAETARLIVDGGGEATFVQVDVAAPAEVRAMVQSTLDTYGRLDVAHNNAGLASGGKPLAEFDDTEWDRVIAVMLSGPYHCMKAQIPAMLDTGGGAIVNTASGAGLVGFPGQAAYVAAKHGLIGLTKVAALDYGARGVRINAICPGTARTPMVDAAVRNDPTLESYLQGLHPIGRIAEPEEIAEAALWLCSGRSSFVLGHALAVDGGYVLA